jgi:hypothetical protein
MTPSVGHLRPSKQDGSTRVFCATCGHSEFVHSEDGNRDCLYSVCDCNRFDVGARLDPSARSPLPGIPRPLPGGLGH